MNRILGLATLMLAAAYLVATSRLPSVRLGDPLGPSVFPYLIGGLLLLVGAVLVLPSQRAEPREAGEPALPTLGEAAGVVAVLVWSALYFHSFEAVGYVPATLVFLLGLLTFMHRGKHAINAAVTAAYAFGSYWMFGALGVNLTASF